MLVPYLDSVSNHNRQITASNASVSTHSPFLLVGDYAPPTRNTEFHSVPTRTANALKGDAKMTFPFKACISMTFGASLNHLRNILLKENRDTGCVDELLLKAMCAPVKKI